MNRSEELAKILGIEPKKICKLCGGFVENCFVDEIDQIQNSNLTYPDFTKPDNFVKLLELLFETDAWLLDRSLNYTENENSFVNNFLVELAFEISNRSINYKIKQVIKQAQQTDWSY